MKYFRGYRSGLVDCHADQSIIDGLLLSFSEIRKFKQGREEPAHDQSVLPNFLSFGNIKRSCDKGKQDAGSKRVLLHGRRPSLRLQSRGHSQSCRKSGRNQSQANGIVSSAEDSSGSQPNVTMMKTTDFRDRDNWADIGWLYFARFRTIFLQC